MLNSKSITKILFLAMVSIFAGLASIVFVGVAHGSYKALLGLPALMVLVMLFAFNRNLLFLLIIVSRVSIDPFIVSSKMGSLGLGAVLNLLVIIIAVLSYPTLTAQLKKVLRDSWLFFFLMLILAVIFSSDFSNSLKIFINITACGAIFTIALSLIKNEQDYAKWLRVILLSSIIPIGYALSEKILGNAQFYGSEGFRLQGTFYHPNVLGFYSVLMLSICLLVLKIDFKVVNKFIKTTLPIYVLVIFAVLLFTKTRSAWVACFVAAVLYGLIFEKRYLIYLSVMMAIALCIPEVQDRLLNAQQGEVVWGHGQLNSYSWRLQIWKDGLSWMTPDKYFFGYGLDSFIKHSLTFFTLVGRVGMGAHNIYVQLFFETGFFGLVAYLFMNFTLLKYLIQHYRVHSLVAFIAISLLVEYALFAYSDNMLGYLSFNWSYWFVLGITIAYLDVKSKAIKAAEELELCAEPVTSINIKRRK
jgi:O-antigen ligase